MGRRAGLMVLLLLVACSTETERGPPGSPEYRDGYAEGCESGLFEAGIAKSEFKKDDERATEDLVYRQGWDDGYRDCKAQ